MPKILLDYNTVKPGIVYSSFDILNALSLFGTSSINNQKDLYIILTFEFNIYTE